MEGVRVVLVWVSAHTAPGERRVSYPTPTPFLRHLLSLRLVPLMAASTAAFRAAAKMERPVTATSAAMASILMPFSGSIPAGAEEGRAGGM